MSEGTMPLSALRLHPACEDIPGMKPEEWEPFLADVLKRGVEHPITVQRPDIILDGRHRFNAAKIRGDETVPVDFVDLPPEEQAAFAVRSAVLRRHLGKGELAIQGAKLKPAMKTDAKGRQRDHGGTAPGKNTSGNITGSVSGEARDMAGAAVGLSGATIDRAEFVLSHGVPELINAMRADKVKVNTAFKWAKLPPDEQRALVANPPPKKRPPKKKPLVGAAAPSMMRLSGESLRGATLSRRAIAARDDIAGGLHAVEVRAHYGLTAHQYGSAKRVAETEHPGLITAMDSGLLEPGAAERLVKATPEKIEEAISAAKLREAEKTHRPLSTDGKTKAEVISELLQYTWVQWAGTRQNVPINSKAMPAGEEKLRETLRLCRNVRDAVNGLLDRIEKEGLACLQRIPAKKTS